MANPSDSSWLPPHMPADVMDWEIHPIERKMGHGCVKVRGTQAYEFRCVADGRATDILAYLDGILTHHWRRDPLEGTWPGTYEWAAIRVCGAGLVPRDLS
jgi:hypothetical protein